MRTWIALLILTTTSALVAEDKLGFDDRIEIVRGLTAEYATLKAYLPKSKKPLVFDSNGTYDLKQWEQIGKESGPAARTGDQIQITKVTLERDKILFEINGGIKSGRKWYDRIEVGMGNSTIFNPAKTSWMMMSVSKWKSFEFRSNGSRRNAATE